MSTNWNETLYQTYLDYQNSLYERNEQEKYFKDKDKTFTASDVIRIYSNNLDMTEKAEVKNFFLEVIPSMSDTIYNSQIWFHDNGVQYHEHDVNREVRKEIFVTFYDLFYDTMNTIYLIVDVVRDIVTMPFDPIAYGRLVKEFYNLITLVNNWVMYWDRLDYAMTSHEPKMHEMNRDYPWWQF
jgi:hypothetical protein